MTYIEDRDAKNLCAINSWKANAPDYARAFISDKGAMTALNTLRIYTNNINMFWSYMADANMDNSLKNMCCITSHMCQDFIDNLLKSLAVSTVLSTISTLSSLYDFMMQKGYCDHNPFEFIERPRLEKPEPIKLTNDEKNRLYYVITTGDGLSKRFLAQELSHGTRYRNQAIAKLLLETGMKVSELVSLNVDDVDIVAKTLTVTTSCGEKLVEVSDDIMNTIRDCIDMRYVLSIPSDEKALFIASQGRNKNRRISTQTVDGLIKKYAVAAGLTAAEQISPNTFRQMKLLEERKS